MNDQHTGKGHHWLCCSNVFDTNTGDIVEVSIYDSKYTRTTDDVRNTLKGLFRKFVGQFKNVQINYRTIQKQSDDISCGLHALAVATQIVCGRNPELCKLQLDYVKMREHINQCLEGETAELFTEEDNWEYYRKRGTEKICVHGPINQSIERISI